MTEQVQAARWPDLLDQDEIWIDGAGHTLSLDDMEPRHCRNVHAMLLRHSRRYFESLSWSMLGGPSPSGEVACDAFESAMDRLQEMEEDPEHHMRQFPLLVALRRRMNGETARPAETAERGPGESDLFAWPDTEPGGRREVEEPGQHERLLDFAQRIIALDDIDGPGAEERRTVTLTRIITWAREAVDGPAAHEL